MVPLQGDLAEHRLQKPTGRRSCRTANTSYFILETRVIFQDLYVMLPALTQPA